MGTHSDLFNARITAVSLGIEDHGILTSYLTMDFRGGGQGFGGYNLNDENYLGAWIRGVMKALKLDEWDKVKGQLCRVERAGGLLIGISHIVDSTWFYPKRVFEEMEAKSQHPEMVEGET